MKKLVAQLKVHNAAFLLNGLSLSLSSFSPNSSSAAQIFGKEFDKKGLLSQ